MIIRDLYLRLNYLKGIYVISFFMLLFAYIEGRSEEYSISYLYVQKFVLGNSLASLENILAGEIFSIPFGWMLLISLYFIGLSSYMYDDYKH